MSRAPSNRAPPPPPPLQLHSRAYEANKEARFRYMGRVARLYQRHQLLFGDESAFDARTLLRRYGPPPPPGAAISVSLAAAAASCLAPASPLATRLTWLVAWVPSAPTVATPPSPFLPVVLRNTPQPTQRTGHRCTSGPAAPPPSRPSPRRPHSRCPLPARVERGRRARGGKEPLPLPSPASKQRGKPKCGREAAPHHAAEQLRDIVVIRANAFGHSAATHLRVRVQECSFREFWRFRLFFLTFLGPFFGPNICKWKQQ